MTASDQRSVIQKLAPAFKILLPIVIMILIIVAGLTLLKNQQTNHNQGHQPVEVGSVMPDLVLKKFPDSGSVKLSSLGHKITLLNFWATWCEACMVEIPSILKLRESYKDQGFDVVFMNVDQNPAAVLPKTLKTLGIDFPVYVDNEGETSDIFDVHAIPLTAVMDKNRKILMLESGELDWNGPEVRQKTAGWLK